MYSLSTKDRLFIFNFIGDWDIFDDVPEKEQNKIMYPSVLIPSEFTTLQQKFEYLKNTFTPSDKAVAIVKILMHELE